MKKKIAAFDFDGTITNKDTLLEFIRFSKGNFYLGATFLLFSPLLVLYKLGLYPNWKVKEQIFSFLFKGITKDEFNNHCIDFFCKRGCSLIRKDALEKIKSLLKDDYEIVIISASIENWIKPFADYLGIKIILSTSLKFNKEEKFTGYFQGTNCFGKEKVNRLLTLFPNRNEYELLAFGDSKGDFELLKFADKGYYKLFTK